ncbi:hypothetical protein YC2023_065693 [Brassica napus]
MAEPDDSSTKDKSGWINGEHTDLKPAGETDDELKHSVGELDPAEESMHELKPAEVRVDELDELGELSDTTLELDELSDTTLELSDTEDRAGLAVGRNGPCSAQGKVHKKCNTAFSSVHFKLILIKKYLNRVNKEVQVVGCIDFFKVNSKFNISNTSCFLLSFLQVNILYFVKLVRHIKQRLEALLLLDLCVISSNN